MRNQQPTSDIQHPTSIGLRGARIGCWIFIVGCSMFLLLILSLSLRAEGGDPRPVFHFGFSTAVMPAVNENDYRAAMKLWVEAVLHDGVVRADPNVILLRDSPAISNALKAGTVDGVAMTVAEFFLLQKQFDTNHCIFGTVAGTIPEEYLLLVHRDSALTNLAALQGSSLNIQRNPETSLAAIWLDTKLMENGLPPARDFCGAVNEDFKLSQVVLPVFFRKCDACLVTRKGFDTMCELNPQLRSQLRVLAASPQYVAAGFFFRAGYPPDYEKLCVAEFTRHRTDPGAQQVFTVFETERLEDHSAAILNNSLKLLERHRELMKKLEGR